jgi:hypothetical protein
MDRYEEIIFERRDNKYVRVEISVLAINGGISRGKGEQAP